MPHAIPLITTIAVSLGAALIFGLIATWLKLPALIGYLMAGILIGPGMPGFMDLELSGQLAEIGVMLMMFGVGLHFSFRDLLAVQSIALPGAIAQIILATILGAEISLSWGWNLGASLIFGLALSVASTVVLLRGLEQQGLLHSVNGKISVGWLVVEDLVMVVVLLLLPPLAGWLSGKTALVDSGLILILIATLGKILLFVGFMLLIGRRVFPILFWKIAAIGSREIFTLCVIATALGIAYISAQLFGVSFALGSFFAGIIMRESPLSHRAAEESLPMRDAFAVLFFVSVGMLFDPYILIEQPFKVLVVVLIIIFGKALVAFGIVLIFRYPLNTALTVGAGLAQIGEFSFILAGFGAALGILPQAGQNLILAGAIISISLNTMILRAIEPAQIWIRSRSRLARLVERSEDPLAELPMTVSEQATTGHIIVVGYGLVGMTICRNLIERGISFVVADQNRDTVQELRETGIHAVAGDASEPNVLIQSHIVRAAGLVITIPDLARARAMIEISRMLNPKVAISLRAHDTEELEMLQSENAGVVFCAEQELAINIVQHLIQTLKF